MRTSHSSQTVDLQQLRFFVRVAELGSFAKAADLLGVPQPTLSRQVRALELEVKAALLDRHGRGVHVTHAGVRFLRRAKGLLHAADVALAELHEGDARLRGRIVCGLTPTVGRALIPGLVTAFRTELPSAQLSILDQLSGQLHEYLRASRIDVAILHNPRPSASLQVETLSSQNLHLAGRTQIGPDTNTVDMRLLADVPLVLPSAAHRSRQPIELAAAQLRIPLNIAVEVDAIDSLFKLVNDGVAHTVASRVAVEAGLVQPGVVVQRIVNPEITTELFLATPLAEDMTPLQQHATDIVRRVFCRVVLGRA